ncbi:hypothetical protein CA850_05845 [Micromonospora echinospora]|nr:hypothetical protein CA850_05845 [Micromonospora echinospora]
MSVCHSRAQRLDNLRMAVSAALGVAGAVVAVTAAPGTVVTVAGALWAVANALGLGAWSRGQLRQAAVLQEMFDVDLFGLPWNPVAAGDRIDAHEVSRLERAFRRDEQYLRDYYEIPPLPAPYDVLACQQQNLGWGSRIRLRYAHTVLGGVVLWSVLGVVFGVTSGMTVAELLLQWFVPSLGGLMVGLEVYRTQRDVAVDRTRALAVLRAHLAPAASSEPTAPSDLLVLARQIQDLIFHSRRGQARVPDWFFRRFHAADRVDFQVAMTRFVDVLGTRHRPSGLD